MSHAESNGLSDNIVVIFVMCGEGGDSSDTQLQREEDLAHRLHPGAGLGQITPVGRQQGQHCLGAAGCQRRPDSQRHQQHEADGNNHHADLERKKLVIDRKIC